MNGMVSSTFRLWRQLPAPAFFKLCSVLAGFQILVSFVVLLPLTVLYVLGLYISAGVSLWRLIRRDYVGVTDTEDGSAANLTPALNVVYSLAVIQGVVMACKAVLSTTERTIALDTGRRMKLDHQALASVEDHVRETRIGCETDPSSADGRNLVTFGLNLMESRSHDGFLSGVRIIGSILRRPLPNQDCRTYIDWKCRRWFLGQRLLAKQLLVASPSFRPVISKLLQTLGPRSPYNREMRVYAAMIVAHVAGEIHLKQFPGGIQCLSPLLCALEEEVGLLPKAYKRDQQMPSLYERDLLLETDERDWLLERKKLSWCGEMFMAIFRRGLNPELFWKETTRDKVAQGVGDHDEDALSDDSTELVLQGLEIFQKLADDDDNRRIICNTPGLVSKIMAPVMSNLQLTKKQEISHGAQAMNQEGSSPAMGSQARQNSIGRSLERSVGISAIGKVDQAPLGRRIVKGSLQMICLLVNAPGQVGSKLCREISDKKEAIRRLLRILDEGACSSTCDVELREGAIQILTQLSLEKSSGMDAVSKRSFIKKLIAIFTGGESGSSVRQSAGEAMEMVCLESENNVPIILITDQNIVDKLKEILLKANENKTCRISAAKILKRSCSYTKDGKCCLKEAQKEAMIDAMPKVGISC